MGLPLNLEDIDKWTNSCSDIGDIREFASLPGACAILNEEKLKELIERNCHEKVKIETAKLIAKDSSLTFGKAKKQLIQNLTQTMRSICREFISQEPKRIGGFVYAPRHYKPKNKFGRQYGYNKNGQVKTLQMAWGALLRPLCFDGVLCYRNRYVLLPG